VFFKSLLGEKGRQFDMLSQHVYVYAWTDENNDVYWGPMRTIYRVHEGNHRLYYYNNCMSLTMVRGPIFILPGPVGSIGTHIWDLQWADIWRWCPHIWDLQWADIWCWKVVQDWRWKKLEHKICMSEKVVVWAKRWFWTCKTVVMVFKMFVLSFNCAVGLWCGP
jgi:hypothetical protein